MNSNRPFSQACANNSQPIADILQRVFSCSRRLLEIGSGTGQHSVYCAPLLPHLQWQPSDRLENLAGIEAWRSYQPSPNLNKAIALDVAEPWPDAELKAAFDGNFDADFTYKSDDKFDGFFTANTCHIMPWSAVECLFKGIGQRATATATLVIYGPFTYKGKYTATSNANFDQWLSSQARHQGIRAIEAVTALAEAEGFSLVEDNAMPANNQLLVFRRRL